FCIDLLNECAEKLEFNYTVHPVPDGNYGTAKVIDGHEVWDGIIGQLQFRKADLAVAMLTINHERERVIDFTTPFMNLGMSIIFKKPEQKKPDLFSFLRPLSPAVSWLIAFYLFTIIIIYFYAFAVLHSANALVFPTSYGLANRFLLQAVLPKLEAAATAFLTSALVSSFH
ncbi:unnamed protein product, partial [Hydatigera taeniaeformis]|uniref:Lig_chan-Glu_bd domain-containing protein n=1 Tax=Hydatigena taeniaeformis TaxID=6205 RepID=A0A0R3WW66_HYDTA